MKRDKLMRSCIEHLQHEETTWAKTGWTFSSQRRR
jgi:hypothetical protein